MGNLDERASDALVWELMLQAGPILNVHCEWMWDRRRALYQV